MESVDQLIAKYLADSCTPQEKAQLQTWLQEDPGHQQQLDQARQVWTAALRQTDEFQPNVDLAWERVNQKTGGTKTQLRRLNWWIPAVAAAVLILALIGWPLINNDIGSESWTMVNTQDQRSTEVQLPDGSTVWIGAHSTLQYLEGFTTQREVKLQGLAYFEVTRDTMHTFNVHAGSSLVSVLGTSFSVESRTEQGEKVTVNSGKVRHAHADNPQKSVDLTAGEQGVLVNSNLTKNQVVDPNYLSWKTDVLIFEDIPLSEVVAQLNVHFKSSLTLQHDQLGNCLLTSSFHQNSLSEIMDVLRDLFQLEAVEQEDGSVILMGKGCQ